MVGTFLGTVLLKRFGRRDLMVISSVLMSISLLILGFNINVIEAGSESDVVRLFPVVEIVAYILSFGIGVGTIPWLLLGELCPAKVKGVTSGFAVFAAFLAIFIVVKMFPLMVVTFGQVATYWLFSVVCALTGLFSVAFLPETKGKSLGEIQRLFDGKSVKLCEEEEIILKTKEIKK